MSIIAITGAPGSGKSTVAASVADSVARGVHIPVDFFRKMVRAGYASPHHWDDEVARQYQLARRAAALTATTYCEGGFLVIIDDIILPGHAPTWRALLPELAGFVLLAPALEVALQRNAAREVWTVEHQVLVDLHEGMAGHRGGSDPDWLVIDNSELAPTAVAEAILQRWPEAGGAARLPK